MGYNIKIGTTLVLSILCFCLSAQYDKPKDFYVSKQGDTIYGEYIFVYLSKFDNMKTLQGERVKLKPDSIRSYTFYMENTYRSKNDPYYYPKTWINWGDEFYEVIYKGNGPVSVLKYQSVGNGNYSSPPEYYFERNGSFTPFSVARFRYDAAIYFSDCPEAVNFLMNVPNEKNPKKTHNATFDDVDLVIAKYNQCLSDKK